MTLYTIIGLLLIIVLQGLVAFLERWKYLKIVDQLTDKVMSRNYEDYMMGQEFKKEEKAEDVTLRSRTDEAEAFIAEKNSELDGLDKKAEVLAAQLDSKKYESVG